MTAARKPLPCPMTAGKLLEMYFHDMRSHLLEAASALDRIERADDDGIAMKDPRIRDLLTALEELRKPGADRAERFLRLFSVK